MNIENITNFFQTLFENSMIEVLVITLPSHICTLMTVFVGTLFSSLSHTCSNNECSPNSCNKIQDRKMVIFIKEFVIIVIPLLFLTTILSNNVSMIIIPMITVMISSLCFAKIVRINYCVLNLFPYDPSPLLRLPLYDGKRSFVTCCRSIVNIMTVISILPVDFDIFPRRFAKTGTYGFSLMDLGVGFFILSNAGVTKPEKITNEGLKKTMIGCIVLFLLGLLRYYSTQAIDYHTNVIEYGIHWNFFFTLGAVKLLSFFVLYIFCMNAFPSGFILCVVHQLLLYFGLEVYVTEDKPRDNWITANREGLVSVLGFTSLYLIGISLNKFVLQKSTTVGNDLKTIITLIFSSSVLFIVTILLSDIFPVSRRLASLTYTTCIISMGLLHVAFAMLIELFIICFISPCKNNKHYNLLTPILYESINCNGLTFFLIGNLLTGLVNILFDTMAMTKIQSIFILSAYMMANCSVTYTLYFKKIQLKFW